MLEYLGGEEFVASIQRVTERAIARGALQKIATQEAHITENGHDYSIRVVDSLQRKSDETQQRIDQKPVDFNPFLPYDEALYVGELSPTHRCLLNKFQVLDNHVLLVTNEFKDQREMLDRDDFLAAAVALQAQSSLVFFNGGREAGASVRHKHLQVIPLTPDTSLPLLERCRGITANTTPFKPLIAGQLPFRAALCKLQADNNLNRFAGQCYSVYMEIVEMLQLRRDMDGWMPAYNLLLLDDLILVVPRRQEAFNGFAVNALGYAGTILLKNVGQLSQLRLLGVETLLSEVGFKS